MARRSLKFVSTKLTLRRRFIKEKTVTTKNGSFRTMIFSSFEFRVLGGCDNGYLEFDTGMLHNRFQ